MYNIKNNNSYSGYYVGGGILFFMGLITSMVFFFVFYFIPMIYNSNAPVKSYTWFPTSDGEYKPTIKFEYNNREYECRPNMTSSDSFKINKIYFDSNNPSDCGVDLKENLGNYIYLLDTIPAIILVLGLFLIILGISKHKKAKKLCHDGILVKNINCNIQPLTTYNSGRYYYRVTADYTFPDGTTKKLKQTILSKKKIENNKCDLLYLLEDYSVYCLDFDIEYKSYTF